MDEVLKKDVFSGDVVCGRTRGALVSVQISVHTNFEDIPHSDRRRTMQVSICRIVSCTAMVRIDRVLLLCKVLAKLDG